MSTHRLFKSGYKIFENGRFNGKAPQGFNFLLGYSIPNKGVKKQHDWNIERID